MHSLYSIYSYWGYDYRSYWYGTQKQWTQITWSGISGHGLESRSPDHFGPTQITFIWLTRNFLAERWAFPLFLVIKMNKGPSWSTYINPYTVDSYKSVTQIWAFLWTPIKVIYSRYCLLEKHDCKRGLKCKLTLLFYFILTQELMFSGHKLGWTHVNSR